MSCPLVVVGRRVPDTRLPDTTIEAGGPSSVASCQEQGARREPGDDDLDETALRQLQTTSKVASGSEEMVRGVSFAFPFPSRQEQEGSGELFLSIPLRPSPFASLFSLLSPPGGGLVHTCHALAMRHAVTHGRPGRKERKKEWAVMSSCEALPPILVYARTTVCYAFGP